MNYSKLFSWGFNLWQLLMCVSFCCRWFSCGHTEEFAKGQYWLVLLLCFLVIATDTNWINVLFHFIGIVQVVPVHFTLHARALILDCVLKILLYNKFFSPLTAVFCFCRLELGLYLHANQCFCF